MEESRRGMPAHHVLQVHSYANKHPGYSKFLAIQCLGGISSFLICIHESCRNRGLLDAGPVTVAPRAHFTTLTCVHDPGCLVILTSLQLPAQIPHSPHLHP